MKVAYFIGSLNRGGTETLLLDMFRRKEMASYESILVYRNEGDLSEAYRATGVPMFRIKPTGIKLGYVSKLRRLLREEGVDVLHTQTSLNAFLGIFCTCFLHTKLVASFHGFFTSLTGRVFTHLVMWYADASVFVSGYVRDWYIRHTLFAPRKRCYVVYNGIDFSKLDKTYDVPDFVKENDLDPGAITMAMVGSFVGGRSQDFLCRALKAFKDRNLCDFRFYFIGKKSDEEPKLYDNCIEYCKDNGLLNTSVFFLGGRSDVPAILQNVDAFVYSTNDDTFGIAVVEAVASGLPVIVNDWEVMKEVTDNGNLAYMYKTKDVEDCVERLGQLVNNLANYKQDARMNAKIVREKYSIEAHIHNLSNIYKLLK